MTTAFTQRSYLLFRQLLRSQTRLSNNNPTYICPSSRSYSAAVRVRRRQRPNYGIAKMEGTGPPKVLPETTGMAEPYSYGGEEGEDTEGYLKKTSLSPWVPTPDPIARKLFDMSAPTPEDVHVELGCGDGRVNFYAIDHGKVKKSIGIDVDEGIMKQARERLMKRYPQPPIEFITADLLDFNNLDVWDKVVQEATILTMYFVEDALKKLRPMLEEKLAGRKCKIITVSYAMPGWNHTIMETTLGTTCYLYEWGYDKFGDEDDNPSTTTTTTNIFAEDSLLIDKPKELLRDPLEQMRAQGLHMDDIEQIANTINDRAEEDRKHYWSDDEEEEEDEEDSEEDTESKKDPSI